jgi:fatty acid-binding protein DegV
MPEKIGVVTDNTADIPENLKQALGIHTIPTNIVLDGKVYRDGIDLSSAEFYRNFHHYKTMVSQPVTYEDYALIYKKLT